MAENEMTIGNLSWPNPVSQVIHTTVNGKYELMLEKAASANKTDGGKIHVHGDDLETVKKEAHDLYTWMLNETKPKITREVTNG